MVLNLKEFTPNTRNQSLKDRLKSTTYPLVVDKGLEEIKIKAQSIIDDNRFNPIFDVGNKLYEDGNYKEAVFYYEKAIELNPNKSIFIIYCFMSCFTKFIRIYKSRSSV